MQGLTAKMTKPLTIGSQLVCDDNSGAKIVEIIGVVGSKGRLRRYPSAGIGDIVIVAVKKGKPEMIKKKERAVITRQKKEFRRGEGAHQVRGQRLRHHRRRRPADANEIKGAVAREIAERFPKVRAGCKSRYTNPFPSATGAGRRSWRPSNNRMK